MERARTMFQPDYLDALSPQSGGVAGQEARRLDGADIEAGRETELEAMTGYVVRKAKELGVPVPVTESVYRMAKGVEYAANARRAKH